MASDSWVWPGREMRDSLKRFWLNQTVASIEESVLTVLWKTRACLTTKLKLKVYKKLYWQNQSAHKVKKHAFLIGDERPLEAVWLNQIVESMEENVLIAGGKRASAWQILKF